ncbi:Por secretion system C-terminal sorting domain-containing protein [Lutibacter oricola]|uniref:Por secretion system C-terminal sorting domain-containing protein n=1 Tax=Lutibacter oricola TaxID=762486 RepID=A0A1H3EZY4_9FLAO|nr:S8 family serine peptidase [Lutibacter oricola]SDX83464.1 Por secretion system C-terminal sorting domain-containing protein [Lutibacter oricola]
MKTKLLLLILICSFVKSYAQEDAWVYFADKPSSAGFIAAPITMLTQRSIDRRIKHNIPFDIKDTPIEATYVAAIASATGISVKARSKWLNALHIQGSETDINALLSFPFVSSIEFAGLSSGSKTNKQLKQNKKLDIQTTYTYGNAGNQINMFKGNVLHENDFTGTGMLIAVVDAGFPNLSNLKAFDKVINEGRILGGYDFVNRSNTYETGHYHGQAVLSTIAGYLKNGENGATVDFVGTAPDAEFYLFISENSPVEVKLEESLWVEAVERADSLGVDVVNSSLGYSVFFDNTNHNYQYSQMDGNTAFITRGAEAAFSRGMIIVNSAGNEGLDAEGYNWPYLNAPADGPSVLTIGAVNSAGTIAGFSSYGPTADNRTKPDVCAQGQGAYIINTAGNVATSNGTSFSSPIMAGAVACLWQAFPDKTNAEIIQLVKESAHLYATPNNHEGYGIPNFESVFNTLNFKDNVILEEGLTLYPNPIIDNLNIKFPKGISEVEISIYSLLGKRQLTSIVSKNKQSLSLAHLPKGMYMAQVKYGDEVKAIKVLKK